MDIFLFTHIWIFVVFNLFWLGALLQTRQLKLKNIDLLLVSWISVPALTAACSMLLLNSPTYNNLFN